MRNSEILQSLTLLRQAGLPVEDVLDVGVQYGTPALMKVYGDKLHHLFEPVEDYFPKIRSNYSAIRHKLVHAAVSDKDAEALLHSERKTSSGQVSHSWITAIETSSSRRVTTLQLDTYVASAQPAGPMLLKIDVEGATIPAAILRGAAATLSKCSAVAIEMTVDRWFERAALLDGAGFDLWDLTALCYYGECLWQFDAIYVARSIKKQLPSLQPMHQPPFDMSRWQG